MVEERLVEFTGLFFQTLSDKKTNKPGLCGYQHEN